MVGTEANKNVVQAFPISKTTRSGTFTDEPCSDVSCIHASETVTVTYTFDDDTTFAENLIAGEDRGISSDVKSLTTTAACMLG